MFQSHINMAQVHSKFKRLPVHSKGIILAKALLKADLIAGPKIREDGDCSMNAVIELVVYIDFFP
jgi:hypothetical protein